MKRAAAKRFLRRFLCGALGGAAALVQLAVVLELLARLTPFDAGRLDRGFSDSIRMLDRDGVPLREVVNDGGERAEWRDLDQISPLLRAATIAVEDHRFYRHRGVDGIGLLRAAWDNLSGGRVVSGASTLTMQLSRLLSPHRRNLVGKLRELVDARRIERAVGKDQILEQYLNRAPYGAGTIGVEAASRRYFGKDNLKLSLAEAALIAGLPNAPTRLNPLRHLVAARARQHKVLARMRETGAIDDSEYRQALAEPLALRHRPAPLLAMHFTDYVLRSLRGPDGWHNPGVGGANRSHPKRGDLATTLDSGLQREVEAVVAQHVESLALGGLTNASVVVLDNRRCEIRAMVGSADYWDGEAGAVNGALAPRQPGSALKPFTYALAFEKGYTPATVVADVETHYGEADGASFTPKNFSGTYAGPVMMGDALGRSLNVPAIRVAALVGPAALLGRLRKLGFTTLNKSADFYGLGLTLGNGEVTVLEMAQAYAALARGGVTCHATPFGGGDGAVPGRRVFSRQVAYLVTDVLSDERLRIAAFGPANSLLLGFPVAVKTGTSSNWRDSWAAGYTDRYTVVVWSGDFSGRSMNQLAGATGAGPLFHEVMQRVVERDHGYEPQPPQPPPGVVTVEVCALSGQLPSAHCPHRRPVHMLAEDAPTETCDWHQAVAVDVRNNLRAGDHCPAEDTATEVYEVLPPEYAAWQVATRAELAPRAYSPLCPESGPIPGSVVITYPRDGEVFLVEPGYDRRTQSLPLSAEAESMVDRVTWTLDGQPLRTVSWPYGAEWPLRRGRHQLRVSANGQRGDQVSFEVR